MYTSVFSHQSWPLQFLSVLPGPTVPPYFTSPCTFIFYPSTVSPCFPVHCTSMFYETTLHLSIFAVHCSLYLHVLVVHCTSTFSSPLRLCVLLDFSTSANIFYYQATVPLCCTGLTYLHVLPVRSTSMFSSLLCLCVLLVPRQFFGYY